MKIWVRFFGGSSTLNKNDCLESLKKEGDIDPYELLDSGFPTGPGMVFFSEATDALYDFVREASHRGHERVLAMTDSCHALDDTIAWRLLHSGASDVFEWNTRDPSARMVIARFQRWAHIDELVYSSLVRDNCIGQSYAWISTLRHIVEIACFTNTSVLITGETGTGKELIARLIHTLDTRPTKGKLVIVDCTTIVPELAGSELFGHEKGAYTGAVTPRDGAFGLAHEGTLFLDEIGELSLPLQAQLLRAIQERTYKRVGGNSWQTTNFRLVCATNRDLQHEVKKGRFRSDLFYRITGHICRLPSLRERLEDIPLLVHHFIKEFHRENASPDTDARVGLYLLQRDYPGNIRDLRYVVARMVERHVGPGPITIGHLHKEDRLPHGINQQDWCRSLLTQSVSQSLLCGIGLKEIGRLTEELAVQIALERANGNIHHAAQQLGVTDRALQLRKATRRHNNPLVPATHEDP